VIQSSPIHNIPHFDFNPDAVYSRIVYAAKSSDVSHTICHGRVLMRDRVLQTIDEAELLTKANQYAERVGRFLGEVETNPLRKLVAVGVDVERAESFEIQVKAKLADPSAIENLLSHDDVEVLRAVHYRQYDTYFLFAEPEQSRIRYREDDRIDLDGNVQSVRMRLTYTTAEKEQVFHDTVVLSHSRFIAPASHPLRFYQEYFQAKEQRELQKERRRWRITYKGIVFFVNVDRVTQPALPDMYIEIKTRTWSKSDAENKAQSIQEMMDILQITSANVVRTEYLDMSE
jgi:5-methylthioadenosine/S-adenosylhomocysteine deaminase